MTYARFEVEKTDDLIHAAQIGRIALTWNVLHGVIFELFTGLSGMPKQKAAIVFYALRADLTQRAVTEALVKANGAPEIEDLRALAINLFERIGRYAAIRNGVVHALLLEDENGFVTIDPNNQPKGKSPRVELFKRLPEEEANLDALTLEMVALFNAFAERLKWPAESPE